MFHSYIKYITDNPKHYWFKAKCFGWGWTPATREGWLVTLIYIATILYLSTTVNEYTSTHDMWWYFFVPIIVLTILLIAIAYKTGEKPRWQWGPPKK